MLFLGCGARISAALGSIRKYDLKAHQRFKQDSGATVLVEALAWTALTILTITAGQRLPLKYERADQTERSNLGKTRDFWVRRGCSLTGV